jgi:hypothetical protein
VVDGKEKKERNENRERAKPRRVCATVCFREWIRRTVLNCFGVDGEELSYLEDRNVGKLEILFVIMLRAVGGAILSRLLVNRMFVKDSVGLLYALSLLSPMTILLVCFIVACAWLPSANQSTDI